MENLISDLVMTVMLMSLVVIAGCLGSALLIRRNVFLREVLLAFACLIGSIWLVAFAVKGIYPLLLMPSGIFLLVVFLISVYRKKDTEGLDIYGRRCIDVRKGSLNKRIDKL